MITLHLINNARKLPKDWDDLADVYFQRKQFLEHTERYNYCNQKYYLALHQNKLVSAAVVYSLRLDLFTFIRVKSPIRMYIVGIPVSVSCQGIFGDKKFIEQLKKHIYKKNKGFVLFLNLETKPQNINVASGKTLPSIIFRNHFDNFEEYKSSLRSNYRMRLNKLKKNDGFTI